MAQRHINTKNGAVAMPTGIAGVFSSFEVDETCAVEEVTVYGASLVYGAFLSNGTPVQRVTVTGFAQDGAASTTPGFGASGMADADGSAATLTYDTTCTLTGSYVPTRIRTSHSRMRAAVPTVWEMQNTADITASWAAA